MGDEGGRIFDDLDIFKNTNNVIGKNILRKYFIKKIQKAATATEEW